MMECVLVVGQLSPYVRDGGSAILPVLKGMLQWVSYLFVLIVGQLLQLCYSKYEI